MRTIPLKRSDAQARTAKSAGNDKAIVSAGLPQHRAYRQPIGINKNWAWRPDRATAQS
jgi:hypothetical protein